jgi:hypothetical protein
MNDGDAVADGACPPPPDELLQPAEPPPAEPPPAEPAPDDPLQPAAAIKKTAPSDADKTRFATFCPYAVVSRTVMRSLDALYSGRAGR